METRWTEVMGGEPDVRSSELLNCSRIAHGEPENERPDQGRHDEFAVRDHNVVNAGALVHQDGWKTLVNRSLIAVEEGMSGHVDTYTPSLSPG